MKKWYVLYMALLSIGILSSVSCRRSDMGNTVVAVPQMADARDVRIVTNAALDEVVGQYDGIKNHFEIDLDKKIVLYHESQRLLSPEYQHRIEACLSEVGFTSRVVKVGLNPSPPLPTMEGSAQVWPNRFTAVISVPDMTSNADANVIVDAIAFARLGGDDPRVVAHNDARRLEINFESLHLSLKNIEHAIACVGFEANNTPAYLGRTDPVPHGWTPIQL